MNVKFSSVVKQDILPKNVDQDMEVVAANIVIAALTVNVITVISKTIKNLTARSLKKTRIKDLTDIRLIYKLMQR